MLKNTKDKGYALKEGKLSKTIPTHLKHLPSDLVTSETADGARVHSLDPGHVVDSIAQDYFDNGEVVKEEEDRQAPKEKFTQIFRRVSEKGQIGVDDIRVSVMRALIKTQIARIKRGENLDMEVKHLWFPHDRLDEYELRAGNPPTDIDRPNHLRGLRLEIDLTTVPETIKDRLRRNGKSNIAEAISIVENVGDFIKNHKESRIIL